MKTLAALTLVAALSLILPAAAEAEDRPAPPAGRAALDAARTALDERLEAIQREARLLDKARSASRSSALELEPPDARGWLRAQLLSLPGLVVEERVGEAVRESMASRKPPLRPAATHGAPRCPSPP